MTPSPEGPEPGGHVAPEAPVTAKGSRRASARNGGGSRGSSLRELVILVVVALLLAVVVKTYVVQAYYIPSASMEPTLMPGDRVLVNKLAFRLGSLKRGDVVVFIHNPPGGPTPPSGNPVVRVATDVGRALGIVAPAQTDFIKRVIGLPGDHLSCSGGKVYINGVVNPEPYLPAGVQTQCAPVTVPPGDMFVMGDNRGDSEDSRVFGPVSQSLIVGQAFVRVWPLSRLGTLPRT